MIFLKDSLLLLLVALFLVACRAQEQSPSAAVTAPRASLSAPTALLNGTSVVAQSITTQKTALSPTKSSVPLAPPPTLYTTTPLPAPPTFTKGPWKASPTFTTAPLITPTTPVLPALPEEAILILEPGPASHLISPLRVKGIANPTFEQNLQVRLVSADGKELALKPTSIQADVGNRGQFEIELPFLVTGNQPAFIQVIDQSPTDGGLIHVASVAVTIAEKGKAQIVPVATHPEEIHLLQPTNGALIRGGKIQVQGVGRASFENTLVIDLLDANGKTLAREAITVQAELGAIGSFRTELSYKIKSRERARLLVRDVSPAFGGTAHLSSIGITLDP